MTMVVAMGTIKMMVLVSIMEVFIVIMAVHAAK